MNTKRTIDAVNAIGEQLDKVYYVDGSEKLAGEEVLALRAGACGALAGIINLLNGNETGLGSAAIAKNMLDAAAITYMTHIGIMDDNDA